VRPRLKVGLALGGGAARGLAHIGVLTRPGHGAASPPELAEEIATREVADATALSMQPSGAVLAIAVSALEISASQIRALLAAGREPRFLLPDALLADPSLLACYRTG